MSLGILGEEFDPHIFRCRDGSDMPEHVVANLRILHGALCKLIAFVRSPAGGKRPDAKLEVLSGWRSVAYNAKVGGAPMSEHVQGKAADIIIPGVLPSTVFTWASQLQRGGVIPEGGLGKYATFTHLDVRGKLARWKGVADRNPVLR